MHRDDLRQLAEIRLDDARALLNQGRYAGAYYLAGYVLECALKACIASATVAGDFPDKHRAEQSWKHDLSSLIRTAGLLPGFEIAARTEPDLADNWALAIKWNEAKRYDRTIAEADARELLAAITDAPHGLLAWLQQHW